ARRGHWALSGGGALVVRVGCVERYLLDAEHPFEPERDAPEGAWCVSLRLKRGAAPDRYRSTHPTRTRPTGAKSTNGACPLFAPVPFSHPEKDENEPQRHREHRDRNTEEVGEFLPWRFTPR